MNDPRPCKGENSNICVAEGCFGEACLDVYIPAAMKIWVDDIRTPPDDTWQWAKTSADAILFLEIRAGVGEHKHLTGPVDVMSLDHDLGGEDTTRSIVLWMCENDFWPVEVRVHSANPVGVAWLEGMIERYKTGG